MPQTSLQKRRIFNPVPGVLTAYRFRRFWALWAVEQFFECHEVLEDLWRETSGKDKLFYNGLIHCAVALHQHRRDNAEGAARQLVRAQVKLQSFIPEYAGVDVAGLLVVVEAEVQLSLETLTERQRRRLPELRRLLKEQLEQETSRQAEA